MKIVHNELKEKIKEIVENNPTTYISLIFVKKINKYLKDFILEETKDFNDFPYSARVFMTLSGQKTIPKCVVCNKELKHSNPCHPIKGFIVKTCSCKCAQLNPETREKLKKNNLKKYGVEYVQQTENHKKLLSKIMISKSIEEKQKTNEKRMNTCLEKYGVKSITQLPEIKTKFSNSFKARTKEEKELTKKKRFETRLKKYGNGNYTNIEKLKQTIANRTQEQNNEIIEKRKKTNMKKYGVEYSCLRKETLEKSAISKRKKHYIDYCLTDEFVEPCFSMDDYCDISRTSFEWKCKKCGKIFSSEIREHQSHMVRCLDCYPLNPQYSKYEKEIVNFIKSFYDGEIIENSKTLIYPLEIDILIPEKKIAIEFDGIYWHSDEIIKDNNYHLNKTELCEEKGYQLIHIFENEWMLKKDIVKSRIKNLLGKYDISIFARKCEVRELDKKMSTQFQIENHIQGAVFSPINIGLFFNDELVSLMTFSKSRLTKKNQYELVRFCSKLNYQVIGGASKLLKYFEKHYNPKSLVSYADRRWSVGKLYYKLGFNLSHKSKPNYWYLKRGTFILESRIKYQKHKLINKLKFFDNNKSEYENMKDNGYDRIFDCGNYVFNKKYELT